MHIDEQVVFMEQREIFFEDVKSFTNSDDSLVKEVLDHKVKLWEYDLNDVTLAARFLNTYDFTIKDLQKRETQNRLFKDRLGIF